MRQLKSVLLLATAILLLTSFPLLLHAETDLQGEPIGPALPPIDQPGPVENMPYVGEGSPYPFPIISYVPGSDETASPSTPDQLTIDVWYGDIQNFGVPGTPQEWINILGNVSGPNPITTFVYSLNGEPDKPLSIGGTTKARLYNTGDFNVEIDKDDLKVGEPNQVIIKAFDGASFITRIVTVNYTPDNIIPLPYKVEWNTVPGLHSAGQPVDGLWSINNGGLENTLPGFDRNFAIGDMGWIDYEATVPVTVMSLNTSDLGEPSFGAGIGMIARWRGHTAGPVPTQPNSNWRRIGALAWHHWNQQQKGSFQLSGNGGGTIASVDSGGAIEFNKTYNFKLSVKSNPSGSATYRFKYWLQGTNEPVPWLLSARGLPGEPKAGAVLLVAHQMMARFGDVTVQPITNAKFKVNVNQPANGTIFVTPSKTEYEYGERVEIRIEGNEGFGLKNWTGNFSGNQNPLVFEITRNVTVGAVMQSLSQQPTLNITNDGSGTIKVEPDKGSYLYGELVTLTAQPSPGYKFSAWSGDLIGIANPVTIVMDKSKEITASFAIVNTDSPISDDFHSCTLNTNLWTFINPLGDGSYQVNGTQVMLNVPAGIPHNIWSDGNNSVRLMQPTQDASFEIEAKFESEVTQRYQMQGVLVEQDAANFLRFETHHDGNSVVLYAASFNNNVPQTRISKAIAGATPSYLRVTRPGDQWILAYSYDGEAWTQAGAFDAELTVSKTGVFAGNTATPPIPVPAHTAIVDYFFNTASPINPEDGGGMDGFDIVTNVIGEGAIGLDPQPPYACGQNVTLTALPAQGWVFSGWSGDLSGSNPSGNIVISRSYSVTATFTKVIVKDEFKVYIPMGVK